MDIVYTLVCEQGGRLSKAALRYEELMALSAMIVKAVKKLTGMIFIH